MKGNRIETDDMPAHEVFIHEYLCEVRYNFVSVTDEEGNVSLNYEYEKGETLEELEKKPKDIPLIGFCGGPLTVLLYMLQGLSNKQHFPDAIKFIYKYKETTKKLINAVTELSITYAKEQINHGIDTFQLFETHAGLIPVELYNELFVPAVKKIRNSVKKEGIPFIFFPKGFGTGIHLIDRSICDFYSVDWQTPLTDAIKYLPANVGVQGNIDPRLLYASQDRIEKELRKLVSIHNKTNKWILNLGHGFLPDIPYNNAKFLVDWIKQNKW